MDCPCPKPNGPFFCERHQIWKTIVLWEKCQERGAFWNAWEAGGGPGRPATRRRPSLLRKATRYTKAIIKHAATGAKRRKPKEIDRIYNTICKPCKLFNRTTGSCTICGCYVNKSRAALRNKIAMASQHCPERKW